MKDGAASLGIGRCPFFFKTQTLRHCLREREAEVIPTRF
jgi:hypothetical protein